MLGREEEELMQELTRKQEMEECEYCKERDSRVEKYLEELELEKIRHCQKAFEREKIARGMMCTKDDELRLREMQKVQMMEKSYKQKQEEDVEKIWHEMLIDEVRRKEEYERLELSRRQKDMYYRRKFYDEQIASANRKRQEALQYEREKENRRLEEMMKRMEVEHYEAMKKKKKQQMANEQNFIQGHQMKLSRLQHEQEKERQIDDRTIKEALEGLRRERQKKIANMHKSKMEKEIFVENFIRERKMASELEQEADRFEQELKRDEELKMDQYLKNQKEEKRIEKQIAANEYKKHLELRNQKLEKENEERQLNMERVKKTAISEIQRQLNSANEELRRQIDYRNSLNKQIYENQKIMDIELKEMERKEKPFTRKPEMFKAAMSKVDKTISRESTNPVHPFRKLMEKNKVEQAFLPIIGN